MKARPLPIFMLLSVASTLVASAHSQGHGEGLSSGLLHPVTGLDHVIAMVAVGLWGAQLGGRLMWLLPVVFPVMMAVGAVPGIRGVALPGVEIGIALSGLFLGMAVLLAARPPAWVALSLVGIFAVFHGYAHGAELPDAGDPLAYGIGFVAATGLLHLCGIALGMLHHWQPRGPKLVRAAGAAIMLAGGFFLFQAFTG